jgi:hypothetical protein
MHGMNAHAKVLCAYTLYRVQLDESVGLEVIVAPGAFVEATSLFRAGGLNSELFFRMWRQMYLDLRLGPVLDCGYTAEWLLRQYLVQVFDNVLAVIETVYNNATVD